MIPIEQEPDRVPRGLLRVSAAAVAIAIAASIAAVLLLARGVVGEVMHVDTRPPGRLDLQLFGVPTEAERLQRRADERLQRYGWVDRGRGIVHVPLDVAVGLYLEERAP